MLADYIKEHNEMIEANRIDIKLNYSLKGYNSEDKDNEQLLNKIAFDIETINAKLGKENVNIKVCISREEL